MNSPCLLLVASAATGCAPTPAAVGVPPSPPAEAAPMTDAGAAYFVGVWTTSFAAEGTLANGAWDAPAGRSTSSAGSPSRGASARR